MNGTILHISTCQLIIDERSLTSRRINTKNLIAEVELALVVSQGVPCKSQIGLIDFWTFYRKFQWTQHTTLNSLSKIFHSYDRKWLSIARLICTYFCSKQLSQEREPSSRTNLKLTRYLTPALTLSFILI